MADTEQRLFREELILPLQMRKCCSQQSWIFQSQPLRSEFHISETILVR